MARKARVYHRYPTKTRRSSYETPCIVSYDGGKTFEGFKGNAPERDNHKIVRLSDGTFGLIEKELR